MAGPLSFDRLRANGLGWLPRGMVGSKALTFRVLIGISAVLLATLGLSVCGKEDSLPQPTAPETIDDLSDATEDLVSFTNIAPDALSNGRDFWADQVWNYRPGVVIFDYDRDGDLDFYITAESGYANLLYRNEGSNAFVNVAGSAGVRAVKSNSSGAVACDVNNDGFQDLYVGARGVTGKGLDYRSALEEDPVALELREAIKDRLFVNNQDGTFTEVTGSAFGNDVNLRSAASIACADVDNDGWLDIYVGNLITEDFFQFARASHPGHYNALYHNGGDLTFEEIAEAAGVRGPEILMRDPAGQPILFKDSVTGQAYEGYDPSARDARKYPIGDPTGRTHAVMFFDFDDDGDPDLWVANDGDRIHTFRNDSAEGEVRFTPVAGEIGVDKVGNWMGFAIGDYDGDSDLDVFITNAGYHPLTRRIQDDPGGDCAYHARFEWGQCEHLLLQHAGINEAANPGLAGQFRDVASTTNVKPSALMPPESLNPKNIPKHWEVPTGIAAYDFGYGATFFDSDNDGIQDLYWLGSEIDRGRGPNGHVYPGAGRMLRGLGGGMFEDITVRAQLLDIWDFDYSLIDRNSPEAERIVQEMRVKRHENGKGLAHGDLNGDGYVDLIGTNSSGPVVDTNYNMEEIRGPIFVWRNNGGSRHWISLRLKGRMAVDGTGSNADGIGARVYLKTAPQDDTEPLVQVQEVRAGSSYLSMDSIDLEFGVGAATAVEEITINWPSGRKQALSNVSVDQVVTVTEPEH